MKHVVTIGCQLKIGLTEQEAKARCFVDGVEKLNRLTPQWLVGRLLYGMRNNMSDNLFIINITNCIKTNKKKKKEGRKKRFKKINGIM